MPTYEFNCKCGEVFDEVYTIAERNTPTKCPKCKKLAKRVISMRQKEPGFTDKLYPYWDRGLNKVFNSPTERKSYLKSQGLEQRESKGTMTAKQERMMYEMRIGNHDPRDRRHAN